MITKINYFLHFMLLYIKMSNCDHVSEKSAGNDYIAPSLFLNHGGGPYPVLGEKYNLEIAESLRNVSQIVDFKRLKAIILVTAHREENIVTISSGKKHDLLFDYYHFPPESYLYEYNALGDPILAREIHDAFANVGIQSKLDEKRGWDHGVFIPMLLINPAADIPIIQVSILKNQNAKEHFEIGKVLHQFRKRGVAIFGSGLSYHNMKQLRKEPEKELGILNEGFDKFLNDVCTGSEEKLKELILWEEFPGAYDSHPLGEADHLMPLIVNAGAGGSSPGKRVSEGIFQINYKFSGFMWD